MNRITVLKRERLCGWLSRLEEGAQGASFTYAPEYLANAELEKLAFHMPKQKEPLLVHGTNLHPFFAGLLPEGLRLKAMIRTLKTSEDDLFTLFAALGSLAVGDVCAEDAKSTRLVAPPKLKEVDFLEYFDSVIQSSAKRISQDEAFAGVQNKLSASMISFPVNIAKKNKAYILKLNNAEYPQVVRNENACMRMAARCGLPVCATKIVRDGTGNEGLLVERFDRRWNEKKNGFTLFHVEDACQFSNRYPADKYRLSMNETVKQMLRWSQAPALDVLQLVEQYAFSYLIGNGDMHAKNISLMRDPSNARIALSPAYDIVCTLVYGDKRMALMLDGRNANLTLKKLVEFAKRFDVPTTLVKPRLMVLHERFQRNTAKFLAEMAAAVPDERRYSSLEREIKSRISRFK